MSNAQVEFMVDLPTGSDAGSYLDMPIEIRHPNFSLALRTLCSQLVELEPGRYFVTTRLPGGQEITEFVELKEGHNEPVRLTPDADIDAAGLYDWRGRAKGVSLDPELSFGKGIETTGELADEGTLRVGRGNLLTGQMTWLHPDAAGWTRTDEEADGRIQWHIPGSMEFQLAQLLQPEHAPLNLALPAGDSGCLLNLIRLPSGPYTLSVQLLQEEAEMLLRYFERGNLKQAETLSHSDALLAERLMASKFAPQRSAQIGAVVGAYALLRFGEQERLHNWTGNLMYGFTWLPDAVPIYAEHRARLGEHREALAALLELDERGLPYFVEGVSYATDRLRLYTSLTSSFDAQQIERASRLLQQLQPFAATSRRTSAILAFPGIDPTRPDETPTPLERVNATEGLDIMTVLD